MATIVTSAPSPTAVTHKVDLVSGGTLTIAITANPFAMASEDREFVFSIIDKLQHYQKEHADLIPVGDEEEEETA